MPDDLLGVDGLPVDHGRDLAVGATGVKADAAAVGVAADTDGLFVRFGQVRPATDDDLERDLKHVLHEAHVERAPPVRAVFRLQAPCQRIVAAEPDAKAARAPQKQLHKALDVAVIGLGEILAAQLRLKHGDGPVVALDREGERARRLFFIFPAPDAEGDERRVQQRLIFERCFDPKILHVVSSQSFVSGQRRSS